MTTSAQPGFTLGGLCIAGLLSSSMVVGAASHAPSFASIGPAAFAEVGAATHRGTFTTVRAASDAPSFASIGPAAHATSTIGRVDVATSVSSEAWQQLAGDGVASTSGARNPHLQSIGLSLLLPGLAQYRMGHRLRATGYFGAEAACWTGFTGYRIQGSNREDSYRQMAELFAGVEDPDSRSDEYFKTIAGWPSSELYNEIVVRRDARAEHGDDLEARAAYYESNKIQGVEEWSWVSESARSRYRDKRNDAQRSFKNSRNMIGLAVANRVVAMIDAVLLERRQSSMRVQLVPDPANRGARFSISRAVP